MKNRNKILNQIFNDIDCDSSLYEWNKTDLKKIFFVILRYFNDPKKLNILDVGCSIKNVTFLSKYVKSVKGINIVFNENETIDRENHPNIELIEMDGRNLKFKDNSFDLVYSSNVFEHIKDLPKALEEQKRVTKNKGYIYATWYPIWSGPKGHHFHDDATMLSYWEKKYGKTKLKYKNNGSFIPDWHHLIFSEEEMFNHLNAKLQNSLFTQKVVDFIYKSDHLNRLFFDDVMRIFKKLPLLRVYIKKHSYSNVPIHTYKKLKAKYEFKDYNTIGCEVLFRKLISWKIIVNQSLFSIQNILCLILRTIQNLLKRI